MCGLYAEKEEYKTKYISMWDSTVLRERKESKSDSCCRLQMTESDKRKTFLLCLEVMEYLIVSMKPIFLEYRLEKLFLLHPYEP